MSENEKKAGILRKITNKSYDSMLAYVVTIFFCFWLIINVHVGFLMMEIFTKMAYLLTY